MRGLDFATPGKFKVRVDRLRSLEYEHDILATDEGLVASPVGNICDSNVNNVGDGGDVNVSGDLYKRDICEGDGGRMDVTDDFAEERVRMAHPPSDAM
ncbi:hypothetical protein LOK49_LG11G00749 [Camellia lanceoleosa]|uniref:Uncharacterized protein n=1 Tax=Camellia lanceoleosa TaxID=1840588 RepID=A0ACC0G749_9ERIC|nr:hypothetical protein LOK49_LG11G00749 [Camellia lanceoleosa]